MAIQRVWAIDCSAAIPTCGQPMLFFDGKMGLRDVFMQLRRIGWVPTGKVGGRSTAACPKCRLVIEGGVS